MKTLEATAPTATQLITVNDCIECFAIPGQTMIDVIHPTTGLSLHFQHNLEQIAARYSGAVKMTIADYCASKAAAQDAEITWIETTEARYWEMLEVLPPARMFAGAFLVGEAMDHHAGTGQPRYEAYLIKGGKYFFASRPLRASEFESELVRQGVAEPIRNLICCCCGQPAPARKQWGNRDNGFGVCPSCFDAVAIKEGFDIAVNYYGRPGIHHSVR